VAVKKPTKPKPKWKHDCKSCVLLETRMHATPGVPVCDLFFCPDHKTQGLSLVARYGKDPSNQCWMETERRRSIEELNRAREIALERGLFIEQPELESPQHPYTGLKTVMPVYLGAVDEAATVPSGG